MDRPRDEWSSLRLSDEELEYFGELFVRCRLWEAGVPFEKYLENPEYYLNKHARDLWRAKPTAPERRGLFRLFRLRPAEPSSSAD
jgi:hypothetical protein